MFFSSRGFVAFALSFLLLASTPSFANGESEVFARLLARLTATESLSVTRYLLRTSPEVRELSRAILGEAAAGVADDDLAQNAIRKLQADGNTSLAESLERRIGGIEDDFAEQLRRDPGVDMDALLTRMSGERLKMRAMADGQPIDFDNAAPLSDNERALAEALHSDVAMNQLRAAVEAAAARSPELKLAEALQKYEHLLQAHPGLDRFLPKSVVLKQLADEEMAYFTANLEEVLGAIEGAPRGSASPEQKVRYAVAKVLKGKVPASSIAGRVRALVAGEPGALRRALGDMTLNEMQVFVHGGDPLHPTPESLLGKYIAETGAQTVIRTFDDAAAIEAGQAGAQGPQKLVVALSKDSFPTFLKYFKRPEWMSVFNHAFLLQNGKVSNFQGQISEMQVPGTENTPFPMVLLKTTEAQRLTQYLKLFEREMPIRGRGWGDWQSRGTAPWTLDNYCAVSAWATSCTQHIGNMPLGDELMMEYTVPETMNPPDLRNPPGRTQRLKPYNIDDPLIRRVWKVPGNQQLAELLGQQGANLRGEFANPGWTIWTLLGPTSSDRVPIVFVVRADHRLPIPVDFTPNVEMRH